MAKTKVEWTDESHNPGIFGCSHYGIGCVHCYAERMAHRLSNMGVAGYAGSTADWRWTRDVRTVPVEQAVASILNLPRRRRNRPTLTFVTSMADMLHESIPAEWTAEVIVAMDQRRDRVFQVLTHRGTRWPEVVAEVLARLGHWPQNVWAGLSASNQAEVDKGVPGLLQVPGVRFLSLEPLLGPVDLTGGAGCWLDLYDNRPAVSWVIVGGESGPKARPMHPDWARSLRDQCQEAGVAFFFKQWGEWWPGEPGRLYDVANSTMWADGVVMYRTGKHAAGRMLDGRTWDEFPWEARRG